MSYACPYVAIFNPRLFIFDLNLFVLNLNFMSKIYLNLNQISYLNFLNLFKFKLIFFYLNLFSI